jgi:predicted AlkP superfamily pyrophosphatase or phosphodiesterase
VGTTTAGGRFSPKNFIGDNFADELRLRFRSKVIAVSMKDRAAIFPGGKKPAGAFWFHGKNGNFVTSTYYMQELPNWVRVFNGRKRPDSFMGQTWTRLLDKKDYQYPDSGAGEGTLAGEKTSKFDHVVATGNYDNILPTPFGNQLLEEFAEAAVQGENLGGGQQPDFLSVSFSSIDYIGHRFGPYSQEVQDGVVRLDRQLEKFFNFLDQKIGLENVIITLTADHAVAPVPEFGREQGLDEQRLSESDFVADLKTKLEERFGNGSYFLSSKLYGGNLYLNRDLLERKQLKFADVAAVLRDAALASGKVQACYSRDELLEGRVRGPFGVLALNGYNAERGGDMLILFKPYFVPGGGKTGTTHGSAFAYDTHIPILFFGSAFKPGRYADDFHITDIVPTLCAALHMTEPAGCMGKPLPRLLSDQ